MLPGKDVGYFCKIKRRCLEGQLDIPDNCDVTFDIGESKLSSITLKDDDIEVPDADRVYKVGFDMVNAPYGHISVKCYPVKMLGISVK